MKDIKSMGEADKKIIALALVALQSKLEEDFELHPTIQRVTGLTSSEIETRIYELIDEL